MPQAMTKCGFKVPHPIHVFWPRGTDLVLSFGAHQAWGGSGWASKLTSKGEKCHQRLKVGMSLFLDLQKFGRCRTCPRKPKEAAVQLWVPSHGSAWCSANCIGSMVRKLGVPTFGDWVPKSPRHCHMFLQGVKEPQGDAYALLFFPGSLASTQSYLIHWSLGPSTENRRSRT